MNKSELIELLSSSDEEEVYIEIDGVLHDIEVDRAEAVFDGFYTAYEASVTLKLKD